MGGPCLILQSPALQLGLVTLSSTGLQMLDCPGIPRVFSAIAFKGLKSVPYQDWASCLDYYGFRGIVFLMEYITTPFTVYNISLHFLIHLLH